MELHDQHEDDVHRLVGRGHVRQNQFIGLLCVKVTCSSYTSCPSPMTRFSEVVCAHHHDGMKSLYNVRTSSCRQLLVSTAVNRRVLGHGRQRSLDISGHKLLVKVVLQTCSSFCVTSVLAAVCSPFFLQLTLDKD